jgi:hypothetical protein
MSAPAQPARTAYGGFPALPARSQDQPRRGAQGRGRPVDQLSPRERVAPPATTGRKKGVNGRSGVWAPPPKYRNKEASNQDTYLASCPNIVRALGHFEIQLKGFEVDPVFGTRG